MAINHDSVSWTCNIVGSLETGLNVAKYLNNITTRTITTTKIPNHSANYRKLSETIKDNIKFNLERKTTKSNYFVWKCNFFHFSINFLFLDDLCRPFWTTFADLFWRLSTFWVIEWRHAKQILFHRHKNYFNYKQITFWRFGA